jgi:ABC-2 type transport system permease protein
MPKGEALPMAQARGGSQLGALLWLKWRLFRNSLRSRRGRRNRAASAVGTVVALAVAMVVAAGLGLLAYGLADETSPLHEVARAGRTEQPMLILFGVLSLLYFMWALVPLSIGSGTQFDPGPLLLYPVSLRKLFLLDLLSELTGLATIFALPSLFAIGLGAGLASGRVAASLLAAAAAALFGVALSKLLSTAVTGLMRARRARGEMFLALLGVVGAFSGVIISQGFEWIGRAREFPPALVWTPPGALVTALTTGAREGGGAAYALAVATLTAYAALALALTYRVAVRGLARGEGGGRARAPRGRVEGTRGAGPARGWRLPFGTEELSALFEKEARYALRNAQLRVVVLMPVIVMIALNIGLSPRRTMGAGLPESAAPYFEGIRSGLGTYYLFVILSSVSANVFGYDGAGMRALVLAPVARRTILLAKNLALLCVSAVAGAAVVVANRIIYGERGWRSLLFAALCFVFFAGVFTLAGNAFSMRYPKRLEFGKRMSASGTSSLLMVPLFVAVMVAPGAAVLAGWLAESLLVEYAILAAFALSSVAAYALLIGAQGRELGRRELDILEAVTGRDDD